MKVSIIMPVYNAAATLQRSLESIKAQTFRDFELVFVDDCSSDGTSDMIRRFVGNSGIACKYVRQEKNGGVAAARNRGLEMAEGDYVAWVDADDLIVPEALEKAVDAAEKCDADIVGWDWTLGFEKSGRYMRQAEYSTPLEALKAMMGGTMRWNLWLFLTRRSLLVEYGIRFIDGANMGEDMMLMLKAFCCSRRVARICEALYCYNAVNTSSISRQFSAARRREVSANVESFAKFLSGTGYAGELKEYVFHLKLFIKLPLIISAERSDYDIWYSWFPDANPYAIANKALPWRTRALQWMAARRMWLGVRLYYFLVYKFVYGIIYR